MESESHVTDVGDGSIGWKDASDETTADHERAVQHRQWTKTLIGVIPRIPNDVHITTPYNTTS